MNFSRTIYAKLEKIKLLWAIRAMQEMGYVQTSRKFKMVARIDKDLGPNAQWYEKDYYRRVLSKDRIENVPEHIMKHLRD